MHNAALYCGDLINRVSIRIPDLVVSFTAHPVSAHLLSEEKKADLSIEEGIKSDMTHFRHMLAMLMNNHLKKEGSLTEFIQLPIDVKLFFSPTFLSLPVKDGSYLQFFHPVFFNGEDRVKFITVVTQYRKINLSYFDDNLDLGNERHKPDIMKEWTKKITDSTLRTVLLQSPTINPQVAVASYYGELPNYMRNVYSHCVDYNKKQSQAYYESELNHLFPAICSRILDCIIHNLDSSVFNGVEFVQILEQQGMGFYSGIWHSDNGRGGDGRGGFGRGGRGRGRGRGRNGRGRAQGEQQGIGGGHGHDGRGRGGGGRGRNGRGRAQGEQQGIGGGRGRDGRGWGRNGRGRAQGEQQGIGGGRGRDGRGWGRNGRGRAQGEQQGIGGGRGRDGRGSRGRGRDGRGRGGRGRSFY